MCSKETKGNFQCLEDLKGKYIINFGGGYKQAFTIEDKNLLDTKEQVLLSERLANNQQDIPQEDPDKPQEADSQAKSLINRYHSGKVEEEFFQSNFKPFLKTDENDEFLSNIAQQITQLSIEDDIY